MKTPDKLSISDYLRALNNWFVEFTSAEPPFKASALEWAMAIALGHKIPSCKKCGTHIEVATCYVAIHDESLDPLCVGPGWIEHFFVPYCPACESIPETRGCVHMSLHAAPRKEYVA
jgi:hypothetical protein